MPLRVPAQALRDLVDTARASLITFRTYTVTVFLGLGKATWNSSRSWWFEPNAAGSLAASMSPVDLACLDQVHPVKIWGLALGD